VTMPQGISDEVLVTLGLKYISVWSWSASTHEEASRPLPESPLGSFIAGAMILPPKGMSTPAIAVSSSPSSKQQSPINFTLGLERHKLFEILSTKAVAVGRSFRSC